MRCLRGCHGGSAAVTYSISTRGDHCAGIDPRWHAGHRDTLDGIGVLDIGPLTGCAMALPRAVCRPWTRPALGHDPLTASSSTLRVLSVPCPDCVLLCAAVLSILQLIARVETTARWPATSTACISPIMWSTAWTALTTPMSARIRHRRNRAGTGPCVGRRRCVACIRELQLTMSQIEGKVTGSATPVWLGPDHPDFKCKVCATRSVRLTPGSHQRKGPSPLCWPSCRTESTSDPTYTRTGAAITITALAAVIGSRP